MGEQIEYGDVKIPIERISAHELFLALRPPDGQIYLVAPLDAQPQQIVDFFAAHRVQAEELQQKMRKRFVKGRSVRCRFQTGDVAYIMGRPFMLDVVPLATRRVGKVEARGRSTSKVQVDTDLSLLTLYIVNERSYDQARTAFLSYARSVILQNAKSLTVQFAARLIPERKAPAVRMREMGDRMAQLRGGALWLSDDIVGYPPDCLAYSIWRCLEGVSRLPEEGKKEALDATIPGWRAACELLSTREGPYANR